MKTPLVFLILVMGVIGCSSNPQTNNGIWYIWTHPVGQTEWKILKPSYFTPEACWQESNRLNNLNDGNVYVCYDRRVP